MLFINRKLSIPLKEFEFSFARSGGPGGQNVNKLNTKAMLRWKVSVNKTLPFGVRERFVAKFKNRINSEGIFILTSQRFRDQGRNVADCLAKLREMILAVEKPPVARKKKKVSFAAKRRRLNDKRHQSDKKNSRRPPRLD